MAKANQYLTIVKLVSIHDGKRNRPWYECRCICGNTKLVRQSDYKRNFVVSCGCLTKQLATKGLLREIATGTVFGMLSVIERTSERSTEGYKYLCQCECGKTIKVYANRLKRSETKSCGCSSSRLNSLNNGGTGIPQERLPLQEAIRICQKYQNFIVRCLNRSSGKSELSGKSGERLHVHHIVSVSYLIKKYELTMDSYLSCEDLYDMSNAVVLTETEHRAFHKVYGFSTTIEDWLTFKSSN